jgi:hypothetical protein
MHAVAAGSHCEFAMASGEMSETEFRTFLTDTLGAAVRFSRDGAIHFVCMDWRHMDDVSTVGAALYGARLNLCMRAASWYCRAAPGTIRYDSRLVFPEQPGFFRPTLLIGSA